MGIIIRQSIKGTIVNYVGAFIGFLTTMFVSTKFLSPQEIGLTRILIEAATILMSFAMMGITSSGIKYFPYFKRANDKYHNGFFFYMVMVPVVGMAIFFSLYVLLKHPISAYFSQNSPLFLDYYYYILPLAFFMIYQTVFETYASVLLRIVVPKFTREILTRLLTIVVILLYFFGILNIQGFILCYVLMYGAATIVNLIYVARIGSISMKHDHSYIKPELRKDIGNYTLFFIFASIGSLVSMKIDVFMISSQIGLAAAGIYSTAYFMSVIIEIPGRSIMQISQPIVADAYKNGDLATVDRYFKRVALNQLLIGGLLFIVLWINVEAIFELMPNGQLYKSGIWVVFFIALSKTISQFSSFSAYILMVSKYYRYYLLFVFLIAGLTICTNLLLIPLYGISGAAIATFIAIILYEGAMLTFVCLKLKVHPFTWNIAKIIVLMIAIFVLNYFWIPLENYIVNAVVKTLLLGVIAAGAVYGLKISEEMNALVDRGVKMLKKR